MRRLAKLILYCGLTLVTYWFFAILLALFFRPWLVIVGAVLVVGVPWFWAWLYQESNRYEATLQQRNGRSLEVAARGDPVALSPAPTAIAS